MGGHITQRPWTPTKRRGPIAAEFAGPGPAWIHLGSQIGKASNPGATMHIKHAEPKPFNTPAPGFYNPEKSTEKILDHSPKYSFGLKIDQKIKNNTPAPNVYNVSSALDNCNEIKKKKAPSYTISGRGKDFKDPRVLNPGPGAHSPEKVANQVAPAHTFGIKHSPYTGALKAGY